MSHLRLAALLLLLTACATSPAPDCVRVLEAQGSDAEKRATYHCWIDNSARDLDSCIGLKESGDKSSVPFIERVLLRNQPSVDDRGNVLLVDTAGACLAALQRIEQIETAELHRRAATWSPMWKRWTEADIKRLAREPFLEIADCRDTDGLRRIRLYTEGDAHITRGRREETIFLPGQTMSGLRATTTEAARNTSGGALSSVPEDQNEVLVSWEGCGAACPMPVYLSETSPYPFAGSAHMEGLVEQVLLAIGQPKFFDGCAAIADQK
jgi:hypothetical protein